MGKPEIIVIAILIIIFMFGFVIGFGIGIMQVAHAQTPTAPTPNLKFLPQEAYVQTQPPAGIQPPTAASDGTLTSTLIPIVVSIVGIVLAKLNGDKKVSKVSEVVKEVVAETVKGKEVDKELARVAYNMNPEAANKITDAPVVKIETLATDVTDFATKAAKTKLP